MSWKVRHQGSPRFIEGLTLPQVVEGLQEGQWEPTDEIMGPEDNQWTEMENHPQLTEVVADLEPPPPRYEEDESRLDMNPLIDVALVLLIFFILTTSYTAMQKLLQAPEVAKELPSGPIRVSPEIIEKTTIRVAIRKSGDGKAQVFIEDETTPTDENNLLAGLSRFAGKGKNNLALDVDKGVEWGTVVAVQDAAKGAGFEKILHVHKDPEGK